jgi:hypothetical protein
MIAALGVERVAAAGQRVLLHRRRKARVGAVVRRNRRARGRGNRRARDRGNRRAPGGSDRQRRPLAQPQSGFFGVDGLEGVDGMDGGVVSVVLQPRRP